MKKLSDLLNSFLDLFTLASKGFQKIFRTIQYFCKKYRHAFPSREQISEMTGYHIRTVTRATNYFSKMGWIAKKKCGYGSNSYFMAEDLILVDVRNPKTFKRFFSSENVTLDVPILNTSSVCKLSKDKEGPKREILHKTINQDCLFRLRKANLPEETCLALAVYPQYIIEKALENCRWFLSLGNKIDNPGGFLYKTIQKILKKLSNN